MKLDRAEWDALVSKINGKAMETMLDAVAQQAKGYVSKYVRQRVGGKMIWSDDPVKRRRQQMGFFAKLRRGQIVIPYRRGLAASSQKMGQSWAIAKPATLIRVVGTAVKYAPYVLGEKQSLYHKQSGWLKVDERLKSKEGELSRAGIAALRSLI